MIEYLFMLPVAIVVTTIAMMSGIGGAIFFTPFFILVLKLDPIIAIMLSLCIEFFGFTSAVIGYYKQGPFRFDIIHTLLPITTIGCILGLSLHQFFPTIILEFILTCLLLYISYKFLVESPPFKIKRKGKKLTIDLSVKVTSFLGGTLLGLVSSGLGEINEYNFLEKLKLNVSQASATSVVIISVSTLISAVTHLTLVNVSYPNNTLLHFLPIIYFSVPGAIIGAQIGPKLAKKVSAKKMEKFLGILFMLLAILMLFEIIL